MRLIFRLYSLVLGFGYDLVDGLEERIMKNGLLLIVLILQRPICSKR